MILDFLNPNTDCCICNKRTGFNKNKIKYGYICWNCLKKLSKHNISLINMKKFSIEELKNKINAPISNNAVSFTQHISNCNINIDIKSTSYNGFNFNHTTDEYSAVKNNRYYEGTIIRYNQILKDCSELINTTKTPKVFFERYLIAIAILNDYILIERKLSFKGKKPSQIKKELQEKEIFTVNDFLDRYYEDTLSKINNLKTSKAKQNRVYKFSNEIDTYSKYMTNESLKKFNIQYEQLEKMFIN